MNSKLTGFINSSGFKILLLVILIFTGYKTYLSMRQVNKLEEDINTLQEKIHLVEEENTQLKEEIARIDDPDYIEDIARRELGLVKPGELLLIPVKENRPSIADKNGTEPGIQTETGQPAGDKEGETE